MLSSSEPMSGAGSNNRAFSCHLATFKSTSQAHSQIASTCRCGNALCKCGYGDEHHHTTPCLSRRTEHDTDVSTSFQCAHDIGIIRLDTRPSSLWQFFHI